MRILFFGDVIGQPGLRAVYFEAKSLIKSTKADLLVVNGENAADGFGLLPEQADQIIAAGASVITSGNHIWQQEAIYDRLDRDDSDVLRPANYPKSLPGSGIRTVSVGGEALAVINIQGRSRMGAIDCPFKKIDELLKGPAKNATHIFVDFHGEDTREKESFGHYVDGRVSAVVGTHTHIPTNDGKILPKGTAYLTDAGSTGPVDGTIGFEPQSSLARNLTGVPHKGSVAEGAVAIRAVLVETDRQGKAISIDRFDHRVEA